MAASQSEPGSDAAVGMTRMPATWSALMSRRKIIDLSPSALPRSLGLFDLTALGVGATLGAGAYILTGVVAHKNSGAVVLSFVVAGIAAIFSALCYAEFGARVPRAGSAYLYSYVTVGEVLAWTTGWQLLLEYIIGASAVARAWSNYLDTLSGSAISNYLSAHLPAMSIPGLASYPDFVAFGMTMILAAVCAFGAKESALLNNALTLINVAVISFVVIAGLQYTSVSNFASPFAPAGVSGIFSGAATCAFAFVGFDVIATMSEETKRPTRNVPLSIIVSLVVCMACYIGVAGVIAAMVPYDSIDVDSPLASAFDAHGASWAKYIISIGAVCGLSTSLMTSIFPMPRIIYAICSDGLLPEILGRVHPRFKTPVIATMVSGLLAATLALIFDVSELADMMSIGTLISYTLVAASVLILRYRESDEAALATTVVSMGDVTHQLSVSRARIASAESPLLDGDVNNVHSSARGKEGSGKNIQNAKAMDIQNGNKSMFASIVRKKQEGGNNSVVVLGWETTGYAASITCLLVYCGCLTCACVISVIVSNVNDIPTAVVYSLYAAAGIFVVIALATGGVMAILPARRPENLAFITPLFPFLPLISIAVNLYLLANLGYPTWIRFVVWCIIGAAIYYWYGIRHSKVGRGWSPVVSTEEIQ